MNNKERAANAKKALQTSPYDEWESDYDEGTTSIVDLLSDLMHLTSQRGYDPMHLISQATDHYLEEIKQEIKA